MVSPGVVTLHEAIGPPKCLNSQDWDETFVSTTLFAGYKRVVKLLGVSAGIDVLKRSSEPSVVGEA
jgi:hypothetical protein